VVAPGGTAAPLRTLVARDDVIVYGAKTGTIDSLGDVADDARACERFNINHTVPGKPGDQPYHLACDERGSARINDSLLVVGFAAVPSEGAPVPLTLVLRFQGVGDVGFAVRVVEPFIDLTADYFGALRVDSGAVAP
jgi:hypothetical protein